MRARLDCATFNKGQVDFAIKSLLMGFNPARNTHRLRQCETGLPKIRPYRICNFASSFLYSIHNELFF